MVKLVAIAIGGSAGALLRYWISGLGQKFVGDAFPIGTLAVNLIGCFVIGVVMPALTGSLLVVREEYKIGLLVGFVGAFTTFSTFGWETLEMIVDGQFRKAAGYVLASNAGGFLAVWLGYRLATKYFGV